MKMKGLLLALVASVGFSAYKICPTTASAKKPNKTYCTCQRGKLLRVQEKNHKVAGYWCEARAQSHGRCSSTKAKPTTKECTCSSRANKQSVTFSKGNEHMTGYYCKSNVKPCAAANFCSFSTKGMTSTTYNAKVRKCNTSTKEATKYCSCKSKTNYYLRYTYHNTPTKTKLANGKMGTKNKYTHGYVCIPRYVHHTTACPKSAVSKSHASRRYCSCPKGTRSQHQRVKVGGKKGHSYQNQYWCQKVTTCAAAKASVSKPSKNYCSCNTKAGEYLKYVRGKCLTKKTSYYPTKCNTGKYKGYRVGYCYNNQLYGGGGGGPIRMPRSGGIRKSVYGAGSPHIMRTKNTRTKGARVMTPRRRLANVKSAAQKKAAARAAARAKHTRGKKTGCRRGSKVYKVNSTRNQGSYQYKCVGTRWVRNTKVCINGKKVYKNNQSKKTGKAPHQSTYTCTSGRWKKSYSCTYGKKVYKRNQTRKAGTQNYKCTNGQWKKVKSTSCTAYKTCTKKQGKKCKTYKTYKTCKNKSYKNGSKCVISTTKYRNKKVKGKMVKGKKVKGKMTKQKYTAKVTYQCRSGKWKQYKAPHKRAREEQCCKRINCQKREVGYYCFKRSTCGLATASKPYTKGYCHCPAGTHITYVYHGTLHGYYCKKLSACSTNQAKPSPTNCTCRAGYTKKYVRGKRTKTPIKSGHGTSYRYKTVGGGHYCASKSNYCPTYNYKTLAKGSSNYKCNCKKNYLPHYYRYNGKFFKACKTTKKTTANTCTARSRQSCLFATNCSYRKHNGRGICSPCKGSKCVQRKTPPPPMKHRHAVDPVDRSPSDQVDAPQRGAGGMQPRL